MSVGSRLGFLLFGLILLAVCFPLAFALVLGVLFGVVYRRRFPHAGRYWVAVVLVVVGVGLLVVLFLRDRASLSAYGRDLWGYLREIYGNGGRMGATIEGEGLRAWRDFDWRRWLALPLPLAVPVAVVVLWLPVAWTPEQVVKDRVVREGRVEGKARRRAARRAAVARRPARSQGVHLGAYVSGRLWGNNGRDCVMPPGVLARHAITVGATGSGKTTTLRRIASEAGRLGWQVVIVDGKGDRALLAWFRRAFGDAANVMSMAGGGGGYDGWCGDRRAIYNRLAALILPAESEVIGGSEYYRRAGAAMLDLAVNCGDDAPRTWGELLDRLDVDVLRLQYRDDERRLSLLDSLDKQARAGVHMRAGQLAGQLGEFVEGGGWRLEEGRPAYFLLDTMSYGEDARALMRFLVEDLKDYTAARKPEDRRLLVIVDEFSAVPALSLVDLLERARSFRAALVLGTQSVTSFGDALERFLTNAAALIVHRLPDPERVIRAAGTVLRPHLTFQIGDEEGRPTGDLTGLGSLRVVDQYAVDPNKVRKLRDGEVFIITEGERARVQIADL